MGFNLAGFAEGVHPALQDLASKIRDGRQASILLNGLIHGDDGDQGAMGRNTGLTAGMTPPPATATPGQPLPGAPPQAPAFAGPSAAGGPPAPSPMPGATPMPGMQPQPPQGGPPPGAGPVTAGAGGALGPAPQVQPNGPPPPPQGPQGGAGGQPTMSGVAQPTGGNEFQDSQKTLKSIVMNLRQANPKARPAEILAAADGQIQRMKGLSSETAALLRYQAQSMAIDQRYSSEFQRAETAKDALQASLQKAREKNDAWERIAKEHGVTAEEIAHINADSREEVADTNVGGKKAVANINQSGATTREGMKDQTTRDVNDARQKGAGDRQDSKNQNAVTTSMIKANAAAAAKGKKLPYPDAGTGTKDNPAKPKTREQAAALPPGTFFKDPTGAVIQKH